MTRWCFVDASPLRYHPGTPEQQPLGGSQSALCWLTRALAQRGHAVTLVNQGPTPGRHHGVTCTAWDIVPSDFWQQQAFDIVVSLNAYQPLLRLALPEQTRRVFWNQHNHLDPALAGLADSWPQLDALALVSHWQRDYCAQSFALPAARCWVLRNAPAPLLVRPPLTAEALCRQKARFPLLAYTSTPGRGLAVLLALFPALRQVFPDLQLRVYSSLQVYQASASEEAAYQGLYQEAQSLPGVSWLGSVSQTQLAQELPEAHCLAYPNRFLETSCIAALEALAAGCRVVTSAHGALPETTSGWARLVPYATLPEFGFDYFQALCAELQGWQNTPTEMATNLLAQQAWVRQTSQWHQRTQDWEALATQLLAQAPERLRA